MWRLQGCGTWGDGVLVDLSGKHVTIGSTEGAELCSGLTLAVIAGTCVAGVLPHLSW